MTRSSVCHLRTQSSIRLNYDANRQWPLALQQKIPCINYPAQIIYLTIPTQEQTKPPTRVVKIK